MVAFDPSKRITAEAALKHRYFSAAPAPTASHLLPRAPARAAQPLKLAAKVRADATSPGLCTAVLLLRNASFASESSTQASSYMSASLANDGQSAC